MEEEKTFRLVTTNAHKGILCLTCGHTSYNLRDIEHEYCGYCHKFHADMMIEKRNSADSENLSPKPTEDA